MDDERKRALTRADRRQLVRAATRLLGPADAEDAVQDAYVRALEGDLPELNVAQAWLLTVVRNLSIDRLRRRSWMQRWLADVGAGDPAWASPSAEMEAAVAQEAARALRLLAVCVTPADGAAVLLHEVFDVGHADIARVSGASEAAGRQQLRRALLRLRRAAAAPHTWPRAEPDDGADTLMRVYLHALQLREPRTLWAMLRQPPVSAVAGISAAATQTAAKPGVTTCGVMQLAGQLCLVLTLDGVRLCAMPLGVHTRREPQSEFL